MPQVIISTPYPGVVHVDFNPPLPQWIFPASNENQFIHVLTTIIKGTHEFELVTPQTLAQIKRDIEEVVKHWVENKYILVPEQKRLLNNYTLAI